MALRSVSFHLREIFARDSREADNIRRGEDPSRVWWFCLEDDEEEGWYFESVW